MTETIVQYHADGPYETARPAINVKLNAPWSLAEHRLADALGATKAEAMLGTAFERIASDFWQAAEEIATQRGLGEIVQEGRSGGWLVFIDNDPNYLSVDSVPSRAEWLTGYRAMVEWADAFIAAAPGKVAALAQSMAMDEKGAPAAARWGYHA